MRFEREKYLQELIHQKGSPFVKIITGARRVGKSFLLNELFYQHLVDSGVNPDHIIRFDFDNMAHIARLDAFPDSRPTRVRDEEGRTVINDLKFWAYFQSLIKDKEPYYVLLDEVQNLNQFFFTLNGLLYDPQFDAYVTGSNSRFLSSDVATEFRGRGMVIHVLPLTFGEYYRGIGNMTKEEAWEQYLRTGGIPMIAACPTEKERLAGLRMLLSEIYLKDIVNRHGLRKPEGLKEFMSLLASSVGSGVNPTRLSKAYQSIAQTKIAPYTLQQYLEYLEDSFLVKKVSNYSVKGKRLLGPSFKVYFEDIGIRNILIPILGGDQSHLLENVIYNELRYRGYEVSVGIVGETRPTDRKDANGKTIYETRPVEVDFYCDAFRKVLYIQACLSIDDEDVFRREIRPLSLIKDSFEKLIITKSVFHGYYTKEGIQIVGLFDFLLQE